MPTRPSSLPDAAYEADVGGFIREAVNESRRFLEAQKGYSKIQESIDAISGESPISKSSSLSNTTENYFCKVFFDLSAALTDVKPFWDFQTYNKAYERTEGNFEKVATQWYLARRIDARFCDVIKYALIGGSSYAHLFWNPTIQDIDCAGEDPRDVFPFRPAGTESIQTSKGMIIRRARPLSWIKSTYPKNGWRVKSELDASTALSLENTRTGAVMHELLSPWDAWKSENERGNRLPQLEVAYVYTMYLDDDRRNTKPYPVQVGEFSSSGEPLNSWSYIVEPDELLYPRKRCMHYANGVVLYDGPSRYWHGLYPLPKLTLDPLPWSWLGKGAMWDLLPLQQSLDRAWRVVDDHIAKVARPAIVGDRRAASRNELKYADSRKAGLKLLYNATAGKPLEIHDTPPLDPIVQWAIENIEQRMDRLSGNYDVSQMMRLNQMPSDNTIEKVANSMSTSMKSRSRAIETFVREFAEMLCYNIAQFVPLNVLLTMLGPEALTPQNFDSDPDSIIPAYIHGSDFNELGHPTALAIERGPLPRYDRAREFLRQFTFHIAPNSLLNAASNERKLMYLQLARAGLVDHWTLLEVLGVPNVGSPPDWANDITQRLLAEKLMSVGMNVSPAGRKASGQELPRIAVKES